MSGYARLNVFKAIAERSRVVVSGFPGPAVLVLTDVLSRRLCNSKGRWWPGTQDLMRQLGTGPGPEAKNRTKVFSNR